MKFSKLILAGLAAVSVAYFSSACSLFEDSADQEASQFFSADDPAKAKKGAGDNDPNFDPNFASGKDGFGKNGPGEYGSGPVDGLPYADGVGARIEGVNFQPVYFLFDQNNVPKTEESKVEAVAEYLLAHPDAGVVVEGYCDERGTSEYNRSLAERRALAAKDILLEFGIADTRIKTISYGKDRPADAGHDESAWAKNRRDEFIPVYLLKK